MEKYTENDIRNMRTALELAYSAKGKTFPNPAVGAVIVDPDNNIVGRGATQECGGPHAEIVALKQARDKARGATIYVTLEPCCHFGRTPPCSDSIISYGIKRVIFAVEDPNPAVAGKSCRILKEHGIEVNQGLLCKEASLVNEDFFWAITQKKAWVTLKLAMTLDGRIADYGCNSKWITGEAAREMVHELRRCHAAVAVGKKTLQQDDPRLTVRHKKGFFPARIVFSSSGVIPEHSYFYKNAHDTRSIVVIRGGESCAIIKENSGIELWYTGEKESIKSFNRFLEMAYQQNLTSIFIEGGQQIGSQMLQFKLVNRLYLFYGNRLTGKGTEGVLFSKGLPVSDCITLKEIRHKVIGSDFLVSGIPVYPQ